MTETAAAPTVATEPVIAAATEAANAPVAAPVAAPEAKPSSLLGDAKAPEATKAEAKPTAPYQLKLGEGADADIAKEFAAFGQGAKLSLEDTQKAYDAFGQKLAEKHEQRLGALYDQWAGEAKADKEIGGDKFDENLGVAKAAIVKFGGDKLLELLTGKNGRNPLGANPDMLRAWVRVGRALADDSIVTGGVNKAAQTDTEKWRANNPKTTEGLRRIGAITD